GVSIRNVAWPNHVSLIPLSFICLPCENQNSKTAALRAASLLSEKLRYAPTDCYGISPDIGTTGESEMKRLPNAVSIWACLLSFALFVPWTALAASPGQQETDKTQSETEKKEKKKKDKTADEAAADKTAKKDTSKSKKE